MTVRIIGNLNLSVKEMDSLVWISALGVGLLGSFHCAGMCGPLMLALPTADSDFSVFLRGRLLVQAGRVAMYSILGVFAGLFGQSIAMQGWQALLSVFMGLTILLLALFRQNRLKGLFNYQVIRFSNLVRDGFLKGFSGRHPFRKFLLGMTNGLLPCGFVYLALAAASSTGRITDSMLYMALFGVGTLPMMLFLSLSGILMKPSLRLTIERLSPYVAIAVAILLIHRGVQMHQTPNSCCEKKVTSVTPHPWR
jgi:uncharacterized protein